jgi:RecB family exonuclease
MSPDFSNLLVVLPSRRSTLYFRRYLLDAAGIDGLLPPVLKTIKELIDMLHESSGGKRGLMLNPVERMFVLKHVVDSLKVEYWQDMSFLRFIAVGNRLLHFFDELSEEGISLETIEEKVGLGHYPEQYVKNELLIIKKIYAEYRNHVNTLGYADTVDKYRTLHDDLDIGVLSDYTHIIIAGVVAATAVERKIIERILRSFSSELILHSTTENVMAMSKTTVPFYQHWKLLSHIGLAEDAHLGFISGADKDEPRIRIRRVETLTQQSLFLTDQFKQLRKKYELHRIAVVLVDEDTIYSVLEALRTAGVEYNLSIGLPFTRSFLYTFLMMLKQVVEHKYHIRELSAFIKHPLIKNAVIEDTPLRPLVYGLERAMITQRMNYLNFKHIDAQFEPLSRFIKRCSKTIQQSGSISSYIDGVVTMLNELLSYNLEFIKKNTADVKGFFEELNDLMKLRMTHHYQETGLRLLEFILNVIKERRYTTRGEPMKGVQVLGLLEVRNIDFDCVVIPSMNEGVFPKRSDKDLFINVNLRKECGLPYDKERESLFAYYFKAMLTGKKEVIISYIEEEKRDLRSRFIDLLLTEGAAVDERKIRLNSRSLRYGERGVEKSRALFAKIRGLLASKGLSPTSLKDYKECPYRFYLKYLINIREPQQIVEEPGPAEWGMIVHRALRNFYTYDYPHGVKPDDLAVAGDRLDHRLQDALTSVIAVSPKPAAMVDMEIFKRKLRTFLSADSQRRVHGFIPVPELIERLAAINITVKGYKIKLFGYPDRVDTHGKKYYIYDYKTRAPAKKLYAIGSEFSEFQLPVYGLAITHGELDSIGGLAYYEISRKTSIIMVADTSKAADYIESFRTVVLIPTLEELLSPDIPFYQTDKPERCEYCIYKYICGRI